MATFRMKQRRGAKAVCDVCTDAPEEGEIIIVQCSDGDKIKIGDGTTALKDLPYLTDNNYTNAEKTKLSNIPNNIATTTDVTTAVANLVGSAPQTLDTLNELAAALGNNPNFASTITTQIGNKVDRSELEEYSNSEIQGFWDTIFNPTT